MFVLKLSGIQKALISPNFRLLNNNVGGELFHQDSGNWIRMESTQAVDLLVSGSEATTLATTNLSSTLVAIGKFFRNHIYFKDRG